MNVAMYKFITYEEWLVEKQDMYPNARISPDNTEVVISCNDGSGTHTQEEALNYIEAKWPAEEHTI